MVVALYVELDCILCRLCSSCAFEVQAVASIAVGRRVCVCVIFVCPTDYNTTDTHPNSDMVIKQKGGFVYVFYLGCYSYAFRTLLRSMTVF